MTLTDFGDLTQARSKAGGLSSPTRGCVGGGETQVILML